MGVLSANPWAVGDGEGRKWGREGERNGGGAARSRMRLGCHVGWNGRKTPYPVMGWPEG